MQSNVNFDDPSQKCRGIITVSVFQNATTNSYDFKIEADNEDILPISYVIEDTLHFY